ncbi:MAG: cation-translocating P-type ATPase [Nanoarchaeota archaeon]|nr:cation-translocating P-type ATPase [Nanoarchaeota archaeon]MBU1322050.1 cation-translocating P-type ATPase [Nanoarchaeota archaeon]MBU1597242.1 cation-translocating P-type ATPase [Nanoarchaeota archaeon]MBU2440713.1 cation-translocating P-type ATPase [Nanoarchaeota archaeon]
MTDYSTLKICEAVKSLKSSETGLNEEEAKKRLDEFGYNELPKEKKFTALIMFIDQFKDPLILLLIFAGLLSLFLHEIVESIAIFAIVLLNALLGFFQEYRAEKAIEALENISAPTARVLRNGKEQKIPAREVVPGDILLLEAGDIVSADSRLLEVSSLQIDEASLTGESVPSKKVIEPYKLGTPLSDQENMAFRGTIVTYGKGKSIVTNTGIKTEFGKIASALKTTKRSETPLQIKFTKLAKQIGIICVFLVIIVMITGVLREMPFAKLILFSLALTVSTIPNSLPLVVTVGLSMGTKELAKKKMLIKKLPAAEGLGSATIICSDKTGTITKNQMTVTEIFHNDEIIDVTGTGYEPKGDFFKDKKQINPSKLELLFRIGYLCNNAKLSEKDGKYEIIGDPTEGSLTVLGKKGKLEDEELQKHFSFVEELPFDSDRKRMSVIFKNEKNEKNEAYAKGAPDLLLKVCDRIIENGRIRNLTEKDRKKILKINDSFAEKALRVLALAYKELPDSKTYEIEKVEKNLIFVGLVGMIDPPREEVKGAIERCTKAGIRVMIITGDQAITTKAVASKVGLFKKGDIVLTGEDIEKMSDSELDEKIEHIRIIARAMPIQKLRVVEALQRKGHIVAMTGDGVNDAPALKKANIGIAMGITGTDVAKEVSEAILVDDNFATIVNAIEIGRNIYDKLIKSAKFFLSCNFGEIIAVLTAILMGFPLPLLPLQILLMNMLTDNFPALGLGFESSEEGIMDRPPRNPKESPLTKKTMSLIVAFGLIMGIGTLLMFMNYKNIDLSKAQTVAFTTLVMFQMFAVMSSRTLYPSLKHLNPFSNMWLFGAVCLSILIQVSVIYWQPLQTIFGTVSLSHLDWLKILGVSSLGFILMELSKFLMKTDVMKIILGVSHDGIKKTN